MYSMMAAISSCISSLVVYYVGMVFCFLIMTFIDVGTCIKLKHLCKTIRKKLNGGLLSTKVPIPAQLSNVSLSRLLKGWHLWSCARREHATFEERVTRLHSNTSMV